MKSAATTRKQQRTFPCPSCGHRITRGEIASFIANLGAGRPKKLVNCPYDCGRKLGVVAMRKHLTHCPNNPAPRNRG